MGVGLVRVQLQSEWRVEGNRSAGRDLSADEIADGRPPDLLSNETMRADF